MAEHQSPHRRMIVSLIAAAAENDVIGNKNALPWHLPDDLKFFRETTKGHPVIMGRKNFDSIIAALGKPLPGRLNIVITRNENFSYPDVAVVHTLEDALALGESQSTDEIFVIGGGEIYRHALPLSQKIYLTRVHATVPGDVTFPNINPEEWQLIETKNHPADATHAHAFTFETWVRPTSTTRV